MLIFEKLSEQERMTEVEKTIADYFLNIGHVIKEKSTRMIAAELYVHPSSISRFCQLIGYTGFNHFKEVYLKELDYLDSNFSDINPNRPFLPQDRDKVLGNKMATLYKETVEDTVSLMHHDSMQKATRMLLEAETIVISAAGDFIEVANTFRNRMLKIGKNVIIENRMDNFYFQAAYANKKQCFILLSYSGEVETLLLVAQKLVDLQIPFMSITSYGENRLANCSPLTLHLSTREKLVDTLGNFSSMVSLSLLLDTLYSGVFSENYEENYRNRRKVTHEFERKRRSNNPLLNDSKE